MNDARKLSNTNIFLYRNIKQAIYEGHRLDFCKARKINNRVKISGAGVVKNRNLEYYITVSK